MDISDNEVRTSQVVQQRQSMERPRLRAPPRRHHLLAQLSSAARRDFVRSEQETSQESKKFLRFVGVLSLGTKALRGLLANHCGDISRFLEVRCHMMETVFAPRFVGGALVNFC